MILDGVLFSDCYWYSEVTEEYGVILVGEETGVQGLTRLLRNDGKIPAIMQVSFVDKQVYYLLVFAVYKK